MERDARPEMNFISFYLSIFYRELHVQLVLLNKTFAQFSVAEEIF